MYPLVFAVEDAVAELEAGAFAERARRAPTTAKVDVGIGLGLLIGLRLAVDADEDVLAEKTRREDSLFVRSG
jgi:hypothetical protein